MKNRTPPASDQNASQRGSNNTPRNGAVIRHDGTLSKADAFHECLMRMLNEASGGKLNRMPRTNPDDWPDVFQNSPPANLNWNDPEAVMKALLEDSFIGGVRGLDWLCAVGVADSTHLIDMIHLPQVYAKQDVLTREQAAALSHRLLDFLVGPQDRPSPAWRIFTHNKRDVAQLLGTHTRSGFNLLADAVITGNESVFNRVVKLYEDYASDKLAEHVGMPNKDGFTLLAEAVITGNESVFNRVVKLYEDYAPDKLAEHVGMPNKDGFTLLMQAAKAGNESVFNRVVKLYQKHASDKLVEHVGMPNKDGFTLLMDAAIIGNPGIFTKTCALYHQLLDKDAIMHMLGAKYALILREALKHADSTDDMLLPRILGRMYRNIFEEKAESIANTHLVNATSPTNNCNGCNPYQYIPDSSMQAIDAFLDAVRGVETSYVAQVVQSRNDVSSLRGT